MRRFKSKSQALTRGIALGVGMSAATAGAAAVLLAPGVAQAAVEGKEGLEIEGPRDRRGFMGGFGLGFGGTYISNGFVPAPRFEVTLGGGITKKLTLGADLFFAKYIGAGEGWGLGGDIELSYFIVRGLFVRGGGGVHGVPIERADSAFTYGVGGKAGLGYEFWINSTAAFQMAVEYDYRYAGQDPQNVNRHGAFLMLGFMFY